MIHVGIIDDDPLVREEIIFLLQCHPNEFELAFEAASMGQFFELLQLDQKPDIVLLDISLAEQNSLDQLGKLKQLLPLAKVIIITGHTEPELLMKALQRGAQGYFVKSTRPERILDVIRDTQKGGAFIEPQMASSLLRFFQPEKRGARPPRIDVSAAIQRLGVKLHSREVEIAEGLASGLSYKEIAATHNIGLNTVRHYVKSLYKKLKISSKQELIDRLQGNW